MFTFVNQIQAMDFESLFTKHKETTLFGRYINLEKIQPLLSQLNSNNQLKIIGYSVLEKPIYSVQIGTGSIRILMWSQMHGNESTTTKAIFDLLNFLNTDLKEGFYLLTKFTFCIVPILNPDGADVYTRENANGIDLNRDFQNFSQPESISLFTLFKEFEPHYCYNLHDQRTIFGVGATGNPATVSFLAPSFDEKCSFNLTRTKAVSVIIAMNNELQKTIPNQVGRFDDAFNINCAGDFFQEKGVPTILFEAGHFQNDYEREITRKYIFIALISGLKVIYENDIVSSVIEDYLNIPQNKALFYDFVCKNIKINYDSIKKNITFAAQYKEELIDNSIEFNSYIVKIDDLDGFYGHLTIDAKNEHFNSEEGYEPTLNSKANFRIGEKIKIVNGKISK